MTTRLLVTLCTYNERDNLERLIAAIQAHAPGAEILVVDDNSPDGTGQIADEIAARDGRVAVLHRSAKLGLGTATVAAFEHGIAHEFDVLINMDADFSHHPRHIPELLAAAEHADVAIGSRYVPGGGVVGWGWRRHLMSRCINAYARLLLGLTTRDNSGSYRCYHVAHLAALDFSRVRARGYAFQEEILFRLRQLGCRFVECPIVFEDRRAGTSKINFREILAALWVVLLLGWDRMRHVPVTAAARDTSHPAPHSRAGSASQD